MTRVGLPALVVLASLAGGGCPDKRAPRYPRPAAPRLRVVAPRTATVFDLVELRVTLPPRYRTLSDAEVHDAYDADRDGRFVRLEAVFSRDGGGEVRVPGFAMRAAPGGPWRWRVRWAPRRPGSWRARVVLETHDGRLAAAVRQPIHAAVDPAIRGPLVAPAPSAPRYLRRLRPDGSAEPLWLFGACRAWVVQRPRGAKVSGWARHSSIDRERELLAPLRQAGFNLLNQWMAPWEYLLVHHDRAEHWRAADGSWKRRPLPAAAAWSPYRSYDQGRAQAFDRLLRSCEGDRRRRPIYLLLSPLPHQSLQMQHHPWGGEESGWSPEDDQRGQHRSKLNGFSAFRPRMTAWQFFEASPARPLADWRSQLFDHQAGFWRYLIARWGYSRALGVWVLVDELDAVGDELGNIARREGWWAHPQCARWLADMVRLLRGALVRADGLRYAGDPYRHPIHAATTSSDHRIDRGGNLDWRGGPRGARPELLGWHWYPELPQVPADEGWTRSIDGLASYAGSPGARARLVSEFGLPDRDQPGDAPTIYYPTLYHHAIWASILAGHAGTAMDWDDGKSFGELRWRRRPGAFDRERYPIDHTARMAALRRFLRGVRPAALAPCGRRLSVGGGTRLLALCDRRRPGVAYGWLFAPRKAPPPRLRWRAPATGRFALTWYDPWTGAPIAGLPPVQLEAAGKPIAVDCGAALAKLRQLTRAGRLTRRLRIARGQDVAFKLLRR